MARLITCEVCQKQINSSAENCPECGHPHEKDRTDAKNFRQILWMLGFMVVFAIFYKTGLLQQIIDMIFKKQLLFTLYFIVITPISPKENCTI
ncbi:hypothetical protein TPENAI_30038 [Tenacibaculum litopenaei]|uniref:hypothetical protein n=1 Tax=Tenacibaculum litopenaei TaxID=396016 RepID=UPI003892D56A